MKRVDVAIAAIHRGGRFFLQRRDPAGPVLPGCWEFPGGKVMEGETPEAALGRELSEEVAWTAARMEALARFEHSYPDRIVRLHPFFCEGPFEPRTELAWGWFTAAQMVRLRVPEANAPLIELLAGWAP